MVEKYKGVLRDGFLAIVRRRLSLYMLIGGSLERLLRSLRNGVPPQPYF
jgi:hypothetical protein